ncbi:MAG: hypothetical protein GF388_00025 [Candidatus Aegiribacteria sp.]|nr:hypothetical protein [Candidatus Aegiribacteria sp.]MBD3293857.1 hypothetical protein [Candidatus Fermentibacteria bacterium]
MSKRWSALIVLIPAVVLLSLTLGCGGDIIESSGAIQSGDSTDPNHANLLFDAVTFQAGSMDTVIVSVDTEAFKPLLKLMENSTGAVLDEWDPEYAAEDALVYTVALEGSYEARVYSMDGGTGEYTLTIELLH